MPYSYNQYTGDGVTDIYAFTPGYLAQAHVTATVDGVSASFTWLTASSIQFDSVPALDGAIDIRRATPITSAPVDWVDGSILAEADMDLEALTLLYALQEAADAASDSLRLDDAALYDAMATRIINMADGSSAQDAVTKAQLDAVSAAAGNVPTPGDPADDNKFLQAGSGTWTWVTFVKSMISDITSFGSTWLGLADATAARSNLGLGSAALADTGTASGELPVLGANGALPAVIGAYPRAVSVKDAAYTVLATDQGTLFVGDTDTIGAFSFTLPALAGVADGYTVGFKADGANDLTIDGSGAETIDGDLTRVLADNEMLVVSEANGEWKVVSSDRGKVLQVVQTQDGAVATGTTLFPLDDTIPQNTEGDEYMTLAITPKRADSRLRIDVVCNTTHSAGGPHSTALFVDSTANALAAICDEGYPASNSRVNTYLSHDLASGSTTARTYKVRAGAAAAGTTTFNGYAGARQFGGVYLSSIIITEYLA